MIVFKRILKVFFNSWRYLSNAFVIPEGHLTIKNFFSDKEIKHLAECYEPKASSQKMESGENEKRTVFSDLEPLQKLFNDEIVNDFLAKFRSPEKQPSFVMRNKILKVADIGSGGGWHRDSFDPAIKIFIPITESSAENGCTEYVDSSRNFFSYLFDSLYGLRQKRKKFPDTTLLEMNPGDISIIDASGIHRGSPPSISGREMLTVYFKNPLNN